MRAVGGESRKPFATMNSKAPASSRCPFPWNGSEVSSRNTRLKGIASFIVRNVLNDDSLWGKPKLDVSVRTMTSSENTGDVIVENTFVTLSFRLSGHLPQYPSQCSTCRDRRDLSGDRIGFGDEPVHDQPGSVDKATQDNLLAKFSAALNCSVSRVSAHASNRTGALPPTLRRCM